MDVSGQEEAMRSFQQAVPRRGENLLKEAENERQALQDRVDSLVAEIRSIHEVAAKMFGSVRAVFLTASAPVRRVEVRAKGLAVLVGLRTLRRPTGGS